MKPTAHRDNTRNTEIVMAKIYKKSRKIAHKKDK